MRCRLIPDDVDSNKLFHLLPQQHRDAFLAALRDPESAEAKALLALESERADHGIPDVLPWWEGDELDDEDDDLQIAMRPPMLESSLVTSISPPAGTGLKLVYNALAITCVVLLKPPTSLTASLTADLRICTPYYRCDSLLWTISI